MEMRIGDKTMATKKRKAVPEVAKVEGLWDTYKDYGAAVREANRLRRQDWAVRIVEVGKGAKYKVKLWVIPKAVPTVEAKPKAEKPIRLTVRPKTYRGEAGYTVKGKDTSIFFNKESQAREYVKRVKAGEKPDKVLSNIWKIKQVRSGYTIAELMRIHAKRSPLSRTSDERQSHQVTIEPESLRVESWITDPGRADISSIDTPSISKRATLGRKGTPRITPRRPALRR